MMVRPCILLLVLLSPATVRAQATEATAPTPPTPANTAAQIQTAQTTDAAKTLALPDLSRRENLSSAMQLIILLTVLSLAPAILIMMTSFTRIIIVLSLLRQALGTQSLPPNQVLIGLSLFMTFLIMSPTWSRVNSDAISPYMDGKISQQDALARAQIPLREFMIRQIERSGNTNDVLLFTDYMKQPTPRDFSEVGTMTLIPAFVLSELKTAFLLGFKIYLPFLIIDMVISAILISMGMMMLPPVLISLPFKLLLFVLVNGWHLITANLMGSFVT
jgi:flagellar biosynthetic protein FliP